MRKRCQNKNHISYPVYGAKGIRVCERWQKFDNFFEDMGPCLPGMSIDRIDNKKGYEPSNCRWIKRTEQNRNKSSVKLYEYKGQLSTIVDIAKDLRIKYATLYMRIKKYGYSFDEAITTKYIGKGRQHRR